MTTMTAEATLSDLLNKPLATLKLLEDHRELLLYRRDAENLVLTTASRGEQDKAALSSMSRLFNEMMRRDPAVLTMAIHVLPAVFPWVRHLPEEAHKEFATEWLETLTAAASLGNNAAVEVVIAEWRSTAEIYADPELFAKLTKSHDGTDYGPVLPPEVPE